MAGDHKCPLCEATFTRPQHVGRHFRSHTGDRPYECKDCPLRFARSDLLSRHVNKAHCAQDPGAPKKEVKKGRKKSTASLARQPEDRVRAQGEPVPATIAEEPAETQRPDTAQANRQPSAEQQYLQQMRLQSQQATQQYQQQQPQAQPQLQAQSMYPNHPLLVDTPPAQQWAPGPNIMARSPIDTYVNPLLSGPGSSTGFHPGVATPMRWSSSDMGASSSSMNRYGSGGSSGSYDYGPKKRACDQCNYSKVRCDSGQPCTRCCHRSGPCTYNKPIKSKSISMTPGSSNGVLSGTSLSPVSPFTAPPGTITSPLNHQSFNSHMQHPNMNITASPVNDMSLGLSTQGVPYTQGDQWNNASYPMTAMDPSYANSSVSQAALGMYIPPMSAPPHLPSFNNGIPITGGYSGQPNSGESSQSPNPPPIQTPSLTSHATSPSSSDELADRKPSLIGSISSMSHSGHLPVKGNSFSSDTSTGGIKISPETKPVVLPGQYQNTNGLYQPPNQLYTFDPMYQMRQQTTNQSDDEHEPTSTSTPVFHEDEPVMSGRRRSSAGVWANAFNSMSLQDPSMVSQGMVPDPYTAVQVAQQLNNIRPSFPMATLVEGSEPSKIPSLSDIKDVWKQFIQDPMGGTPSQEKQQHGESRSSIGSTALNKSNSMPEIKSPSAITEGENPYNGEVNYQATHRNIPQAQPMQHGSTAPAEDSSRQTWQNQIQQRQSGFNIQLAAKFGRDTTGTGSAMLPPSHNTRPVASIIQLNGALQQTLGPERAPSFGSTPSTEKTNPTFNWSRTPSKLASRTSMTTAAARPGNKRMPSQTLGPEAKKRSASFSAWDESDTGILGDTEDNDNVNNSSAFEYDPSSFHNIANFHMPNTSTSAGNMNGGPASGQQYPNYHARSASMSAMGGLDLSMFINPNQTSYASVPGPSTNSTATPTQPM